MPVSEKPPSKVKPRLWRIGLWSFFIALAILIFLSEFSERIVDWRGPATAEQLARKFDLVAFRSDLEPGRVYKYIHKWDDEISYTVLGESDYRYYNWLSRHLETLHRLTGLTFKRRSKDSDKVNFKIYFLESEELHDILPDKARINSDNNPVSVTCFAGADDVSGKIVRGVAVIPTDISLRLLASCLLEEITQALGLPADTDYLNPSIFTERYLMRRLSINDRFLVRALYDDRITPGMAREKVLKIVRVIFKELLAAYERDGMKALIHPRYKARQK